MDTMAVEVGIEVVAWIGMTVIVVVTDDSNVTLDSILPKVQGLDLLGLIPGRLPLLFSPCPLATSVF